jgi:hypothetical protein
MASRGRKECACDGHPVDRGAVDGMARRPIQGMGHTFREHRERHARLVRLGMWSGRVIDRGQSDFGEQDLRGGEPFDYAHEAVAEGALPYCQCVGGRVSL